MNDDIPNLSKLSKDELFKKDIFGRTLLHVIILTNQIEQFKSVLKNDNIDKVLLICDYENGWNILHYIIFHKRIAILKPLLGYFRSINNLIFNTALIEMLKCKDRNGNVPLQLMNNDFKNLLWIPEYVTDNGYEFTYKEEKNLIEWDEQRGGSEIFVLGSNVNNQLGLGDSTDRSTPSRVSHDTFKLKERIISEVMRKPRYKKIAISKNHSVVLTLNGEMFSAGIGSRGRLGHSQQKNCFQFKQIDLFECADVAISNNHSIVLTEKNEIYAWGLNSFNQLGCPNQKAKNYLDNYISTPTLINLKHKETLFGVEVSKIHSVTWSKNNLYFWGLNVGQMGILCDGDIEVKVQDQSLKGDVQLPKMISLRDEIKFVSTSELITCVVTIQNDIHVYYNNQHFKLPKVYKGNDKHFDIFKPARITEAAIIQKIVTKGPENSMILLSNGSILKFAINVSDIKNTRYTSVWKAYDHELAAKDFDISSDGSVVLCTRYGHVFIKSVVSNQRKSSMSGTTLPIALSKNKFKKIENVNKVVRVTCDAKFLSFGFIRDDIDLLPFELRKNRFFKDIEYLSSASEANFYRKQDQLFQEGRKTYISSFIPVDRAEEELSDGLFDKYRHYFKAPSAKYEDMYENYENNELQQIENLFISDEAFLRYKFSNEVGNGKNFDCHILIDEVKIGVHKQILRFRSPIFDKLLNLSDPNEHLVTQINARWIPKESVLRIENAQILSVLLFIHTIYSDRKVDIWRRYTSRHDYPNNLRIVHDEYEILLRSFDVSYNQPKKFVNSFQNFQDGDISFKLSDGEMQAHSFILKSRSAYFETLLSGRWENIKQFDFSGLNKFQMSFILKHLYGVSNTEIFDEFDYEYSERDEFINKLLELIEVTDELLLFQLKDLIQSVIGDLLSLENVLILIVHADYLSCKKLFHACCWYIYNNLECLIFDSSFKDIPNDILIRLETQIRLFQECHIIDMHSKNIWIENHQLLNQFMCDLSGFNENFMSDKKGYSSFEPLIDNDRKPKEVAKRKKSRKSITQTNDILDFRKTITGKDFAPVIEEDAFITVERKSRKKSPSPESTPDTSLSEAIVNKSPISNDFTMQNNWAQPKLQIQDKPSIKLSLPLETKVKPKLKFGPVTKVSQKERKKLAAAAAAAAAATITPELKSSPSSSSTNLAPWSNVSSQSKSSDSINELPILGSAKVKSNGKPSPPQRSSSMSASISLNSSPSLQDIMIQETLKLEQLKIQDTERKSLLEIQKEQEFAKWWEEESKRVQKDMEKAKKQPRKRRTQKSK